MHTHGHTHWAHRHAWQSSTGAPLVEAVLGAVAGAQLPVVLQVVVPQQPAQHVQELVKADLVVLVLVRRPEQLGDEVQLPPALRKGTGSAGTQARALAKFQAPPPEGKKRRGN